MRWCGGWFDALRVRMEIMRSHKCGIVGKSQSVIMMINPIIFTRTRIRDALELVKPSAAATDEDRLYHELQRQFGEAHALADDDLSKKIAVIMERARLQLQAGENDRALVTVKEAMALDPDNARVCGDDDDDDGDDDDHDAMMMMMMMMTMMAMMMI
eukprot:COSAG01_NODE_254_length_20214_cov_25.086254_6_plen_157_part_00